MRKRTSSPLTYTARSGVTSILNSGLRYCWIATVAFAAEFPAEALSVQSPSGNSCGSSIDPSAEPCDDNGALATSRLAPSGPLNDNATCVASGIA